MEEREAMERVSHDSFVAQTRRACGATRCGSDERARAHANALPPPVLQLGPVLEGESVNKVRVPEDTVHLVRGVELEHEAEGDPLRHGAEDVLETPHRARPQLRARAARRLRGAPRNEIPSALVSPIDVIRVNLHLADFKNL